LSHTSKNRKPQEDFNHAKTLIFAQCNTTISKPPSMRLFGINIFSIEKKNRLLADFSCRMWKSGGKVVENWWKTGLKQTSFPHFENTS